MMQNPGPVGMILEEVQIGGVEMIYAYAYALFDGVTSTTLDVALPRNALVDEFLVQVQARRVDSVKVQEVAQLRSYSNAGAHEMVIDFGTPRTVSGVDLQGAANVLAVYPWLGSQFAAFSVIGTTPSTATSNAVFAELRSERLRVQISGALSASQIAEVRLHLPEPPSGLQITIDGGTPAWSHPEPVQPRPAVNAPDATGWDSESRRIVALTDALAALTGDPLAPDELQTFKLALTTQVPCALKIAVHGTPKLRRIRRVRFATETAITLTFADEGAIDLPLPLPDTAAGAPRSIDELRWMGVGELPLQRVIPPVGPGPELAEDGQALAELLIDPERAACVRLPAGTGLAELTGIRLPLAASGDGAEARIVLWSGGSGAAPVAPLPDATSEPLTLSAAANEAWVGFDFAKPVAIDPEAMPWLALVATRGKLTWALARATGAAGALVDQQIIRRGPPNGPWKALPAPLQSSSGILDARGRLRLVGLAPKTAPLAALTMALADRPAVDLNPSAKGEAMVLPLSPGVVVTQPLLRLIGRVAGSLQLRDVDVVSSN